VCLYLKDEKCLFAGDTLFYLGCGRVFEGSMEQMWSSLLKLRNLPDDTLVYCGHEYTSSNARFATYIDPKNKLLKIANEEINKIRDQKLPTVPFDLGKEKYINPFLRADNNDFTSSIGLVSNIPSECFSYIRKQKDNF
jgi:hydroxyacylglutathione hydrolase